jgi:hypothetical protein
MFTFQNVALVLTVWTLVSIPVGLTLGKAIRTMDTAPVNN